MLLQKKSGAGVSNLDQWRACVRPNHWVAGHSAYEFAARWCEVLPQIPNELLTLFGSHDLTRSFAAEVGVIECCTPVDPFPGGVRNHDMSIRGRDRDPRVKMQTTVGIEAKAAETFGELVGRYYEANGIERSNIRKRIQLLAVSLYGRPLDEAIKQLRYQLLHALAGTLVEAKKAEAQIAVLVVWEFANHASNQNHASNHKDFVAFVQSFLGLAGVQVETGTLYGPFAVPGGPWIPGNIPVLIGKISTPPRGEVAARPVEAVG